MSRKIGRGFVFVFFLLGGICHFLLSGAFVSIMPDYVPASLHLPAVYVSGVFEIVGAVGILIPALRRTAGNGLMALTVAVTPANVHMWLHAERFPDFPPAVLALRLALQLLLLYCIGWSTRDARPKNPFQ